MCWPYGEDALRTAPFGGDSCREGALVKPRAEGHKVDAPVWLWHVVGLRSDTRFRPPSFPSGTEGSVKRSTETFILRIVGCVRRNKESREGQGAENQWLCACARRGCWRPWSAVSGRAGLGSENECAVLFASRCACWTEAHIIRCRPQDE